MQGGLIGAGTSVCMQVACALDSAGDWCRCLWRCEAGGGRVAKGTEGCKGRLSGYGSGGGGEEGYVLPGSEANIGTCGSLIDKRTAYMCMITRKFAVFQFAGSLSADSALDSNS